MIFLLRSPLSMVFFPARPCMPFLFISSSHSHLSLYIKGRELIDIISSGRPSSRMKKRSVVHDDKSTSKPFEGLNGRDKNSRTSPRFKPMNKGDDLRPFDAAVAQDQERNRDRKLPPSSPRQSADSPQNSRYSSRSRSNSYCDGSPKSSRQYNSQRSKELVQTQSGCSWYKLF